MKKSAPTQKKAPKFKRNLQVLQFWGTGNVILVVIIGTGIEMCQVTAIYLKIRSQVELVYGFPKHGDVIKWKHFPRYWPFVREFTGPRWITRTKASDAELWCFFWSAPE